MLIDGERRFRALNILVKHGDKESEKINCIVIDKLKETKLGKKLNLKLNYQSFTFKMKHIFKPLPKPAQEFNKEFPTSKKGIDKRNIIIIILLGVLIIIGGYFFLEKVDFCEQAKNESLALGQQQGMLFWK